MVMVDRQWWNDDAFSQIARYEKIINSFSKISLNDKDKKEIISYMIECFQQRVNNLKSQVTTQDEVISNVDRNKIQSTRLSWHNDVRNDLWLSPYKINSSLNYSALVWAQELANNGRTSNTHSRDSSYWYNYDKIMNWFNNLWISFNYKSTAFTENIAYQWYKCNKSDCTQELVSALRKWFDFFMSEKSYNWSHYRAIIHEYFDQLWFGVATNWKYYWVVTHYAINVK